MFTRSTGNKVTIYGFEEREMIDFDQSDVSRVRGPWYVPCVSFEAEKGFGLLKMQGSCVADCCARLDDFERVR